MNHPPYLLLIISICLLLISCGTPPASEKQRPNVLFIAVDDLRPELGCYGASHMHTPNFDRLASRGTIFNRAYCQQAVCAPSRNSLMTGLRPDAIDIYDLYTFFREKVPDVITLPQQFKRNGYHTERMGKIYHTAHGNRDDSLSWTVPGWNLGVEAGKLEAIQRGDTTGLERDFPKIGEKKLPYYRSHEPEAHMSDAMIANQALNRLRVLKDSAFFLAVGFLKPHLPFVAPQKYWDLYDPATIAIPDQQQPSGMSDFALANFGELRKYHDIPAEGPLDDEKSRELIHGYYAAVSMIDAQVGRLLDALDELGLSENTIIVLWGDHGWKLGEYGNWCKHSNVELDTRVPMFFSVPWLNKGQQTESLAEFVDIYPTLCDLAGIELPAHLQGESLVPVLEDPQTRVKSVAISQYPRGKSLGYDRKREWMGYSMRTDQYRYTRWQSYEDDRIIIDRELYDHSDSPIATENLAGQPGYESMIQEMDIRLSQELAKTSHLRNRVPR